jgi:segregation and condensation protein B
MAVGMPIETAEIHEESSVAMAKKKKNETTTIQSTDLESAASEWSSDPTVTGFNAEASVKKDESTDEKPAPVTFVNDPYGLGATLEAVEAHRTDEELELDVANDSEDEETGALELAADHGALSANDELEEEGSEESEADESEVDDGLDEPLALETNEAEIAETLDRLQKKLASDEAETAKAMAEAHVLSEEEAQAHLANQIAEDEALEKELSAEEETDEQDPELLAALPKEPEEDDSGNLDLREMESCIEALLFMSEKPMSPKKLRELLGPEMQLDWFEQALTNIQARYSRLSHGIELVEIAHGWQFRTKPARAALAKKLAKIQTQRLSTGAMETLAIVAYKQPVMKDDVDKIRGVDSSHFIRGLLDKKLIKISGRSELPGRPMLYETSTEFLEIFSLKNLEALPPLKELESMVPGSESGNPDDLDPRVRKMRELVSEMNADDSVSLLYNARDDEQFLSDIRERVKSIEITTPTLQAQADEEEAAKQAEKARKKAIESGEIDEQAESFAAAVADTETGKNSELPLE